jgi:protein TonB
MAPHKKQRADLRSRYALYMQLGFVGSLLVLIGVTNAPMRQGEINQIVLPERELVQMKEILQTVHLVDPPPPPRPLVPVEVPDDEILENDELDIDASAPIDHPLIDRLPPPAVVQETPEPEIFFKVEEPPLLIGGYEGLHKRIQYPSMARKANVEGRVTIEFVVDEQGNVTEAKVLTGIGAGCNEEALRAIEESKFEPGRQRGKAVKVRMSLPVIFRLR